MSGDVEKNSGPNECRSDDQEVCNTSREQPASEMSTDETNPYDIGLIRFSNTWQLTNEQKYDFILCCWQPEPLHNFPTILEGKNNRSFRYEWLRTYPWLRYGGICLPCVLFGNDTTFERLGKLFKSPLKLWTSAASKLSAHKKRSKKYKNSTTDFQLFKVSMQSKRRDIDELLFAQLEKRVKENREKLSPIVKCILLCGKTNQALRDEKQGNFKDLIEFRIDSGDVKLKEQIERADKNMTYLSKTNQNQLIGATSKFIRNAILTNINNGSRFYSIMADEATDISNKEQLSVIVRYVAPDLLLKMNF